MTISVHGHSVPGYSESYAAILGAKEEDSEDELQAVNHFWDPDGGPEGGIPWFGSENAYQRARRYWGEATVAYAGGQTNTAFYKLGRISHLLADMSVPAHTHNDQHLIQESYENYMAEYDDDYDDRYNYHLWTHAVLAPISGASLYDIFYSMAESSDNFDSNDADGEYSSHYEGHNDAWETQAGLWGWYDVSYAECRNHGDVLMPEVMQRLAGLYLLFWETVKPPPQTNRVAVADMEWSVDSAEITLIWNASTGVSYAIESGTNLMVPFQDLTNNIAASPPTNRCALSFEGPCRFYRILEVTP